jgi:hypothetical protein
VLRDAWLSAGGDRATRLAPAFQETLRMVGALLDETAARGAYLVLAPEWVQLHAFGAHGPLQLGLLQLCQEIAARTALRGRVPPADPTALDRYETRLRVVGAELDRAPVQAYELVITPRAIEVESTTGYQRTFADADLAALLPEHLSHRQPPAASQP